MTTFLTGGIGGSANTGPGQAQVLSDGNMLTVTRSSSAQVELKYSTDRITFASKGTYSPASWHANREFGATVDESDNLLLCWMDTSNVIKYVKFTKSGTTWTAGSAETVDTAIAATGSNFRTAPSVDAMGGGVVLVAWMETVNNGSTVATCRFRLRLSGGSWSSQFTESFAGPTGGGSVTVGRFDSPKIAYDMAGAVSNQQAFAFLIGGNHGSLGAAAMPWKLGVKTVNVSTGSVVSTTIIDAAALGGVDGASVIASGLYSSAAGKWQGGGATYGATSGRQYFAFEISKTAYTKAPVVTTGPDLSSINDVVCGSGSRITIVEYDNNLNALWAWVAVFTSTGVLWLPRLKLKQTPGAVGSFSAQGIVASGNRNASTVLRFAVILYSLTSGSLDTWVFVKPLNPVVPPTSSLSPTGTTVATDTPTLRCNPYDASGDFDMQTWSFKALWKLVNLDVGAVYVNQDDSSYAAPSTSITASRTAYGLSRGAWTMTAFSLDPWGEAGAETPTPAGFIIAHTASAVVAAPVNGRPIPYDAAIGTGLMVVAWTFHSSSGGDFQTAYQIVVERNDDGTAVYDSGKVSSGSFSVQIAISSIYKAIPLRVKVRVWDAGDYVGIFSDYSVFTMYDYPVPTVTAPTGVVADPTPTFTWTFSAANGRTLVGTYIVVSESPSPFNDETPIMAVSISGAALSYTPPVAILSNSKTYYIAVLVTDSVGLRKAAFSTITTSWPVPAYGVPTITVATLDELGCVNVSWTNATKDSAFYSWRLYRRMVDPRQSLWTLLRETLQDTTAYTYADYLVAANSTYEYAVVQVITEFGGLVESNYVGYSTGLLVSTHYWLLHKTDNSMHIPFWQVTADDYVSEIETFEMKLIGRRKYDYGTRWGVKGVLKAQLRDNNKPYSVAVQKARGLREKLLILKALRTEVYLRNPFGDLWLVALEDIGIGRVAGVGTAEYVDISVPYAEVT